MSLSPLTTFSVKFFFVNFFTCTKHIKESKFPSVQCMHRQRQEFRVKVVVVVVNKNHGDVTVLLNVTVLFSKLLGGGCRKDIPWHA